MDNKEFARRRKQLMRMVGQGGIAVLPAAPMKVRTRDTEHAFRQDSDFHYLSGFDEPEAVMAIVPGRANGEYVLFVRERDEKKERWDGYRAGPEGAIERHGADDAFPIDDIDDILPGIMESCSRVYYTMGAYADFDSRMTDWVKALRSRGNKGVHTPQEFVALDHLLHDMRLYKSRAELATMRKAAKIAAAAHTRAMQVTQPGMYEYEIEAEFLHEFRKSNAVASYNPIVGGGKNGCILHYVENSAQLQDGELLLIDAGCEYDYYASDITRTFPVSGKFSPEQLAIYEIVLEAQYAAIDKTTEGNHWDEPHDAAVKVITKGLKKLGLLKGTLRQLIKDGAYQEFFMHRTGHWLGMDVHDVGDYKVGDEWRMLESGMVTTVEPGIYISPARSVPKRWWNIGVRIEDDVAVTRKGPDVLSKDVVKEPDDIERVMNGR